MSQVPIADTWLKEFEEAMLLAEDIATRLRERDSILGSGGDPSQLIAATRRKITVLGTCLDRLESLLQNPPEKPRVDEEELYRRQDMLLGIRFKTKQMAASFSTSHPSNRVLRSGEDVDKNIAEPSKASIVDPQKHKVQEQDEGIKRLETKGSSTRHVVLTIDEDVNLRAHLLNESRQGAELEDVQLNDADIQESSGCSYQIICLIILGIVALMLIVWTIARIL